jgi:dihydroflavonol-4-reductase
MTRVLVLGATGFIGGHIALAAAGRGWQVRGLRRRAGAVGHLTQTQVAWFDGDLEQPQTLAPAFQDVDVVFHAAGYYPQDARSVPEHVARAVRQTRVVLDACCEAGVRRLIYTSTLTTIGHPPKGEARLADERDHYTPGSLHRAAYYECKYAMESEVLRAAAAGLPALAVNPTAVFGPGDHHPALGAVLLAVARGWVRVWLEAEINAVDVRDVAQAQVRAAEKGAIGERTILGGHNLALRDLITLAAEIAGVPPPRVRLPLWLIDLAAALADRIPRLGLMGNHLRAVRHWQGYNCEKARRTFDMTPRPPKQTLSDAFCWYREHGYLT